MSDNFHVRLNTGLTGVIPFMQGGITTNETMLVSLQDKH
jgi:hypothetical protein